MSTEQVFSNPFLFPTTPSTMILELSEEKYRQKSLKSSKILEK